MANKTVVWTVGGLVGETGLTLLLFAEGGNSAVNGSGDALTNSAYGRLTCTVTEALAGWYDAVIIDGSSNIVTERGPDAKLYFPGDIAGTYVVGKLTTEAQYYADQNYFQPVTRSTEDEKPISFLWELTGRSFTSSTRSIDGGASASISGTISELGAVGTKYEYSIAYNAADRPTVEGVARYTLTDGTNTRYLTLRIETIVAQITVLPVTGTVTDSATGTSIQAKVLEQKTVVVAVTDSNGNSVDLTAITLEMVFESGSTEVVIANADIGRNTTSFWFTTTTTLTTAERLWRWSLRVPSTDQEFINGTLEVTYSPVGP